MRRRFTVWWRGSVAESWRQYESQGLRAWLWSHAAIRERQLRRRGLDVQVRDATAADLADWQQGGTDVADVLDGEAPAE